MKPGMTTLHSAPRKRGRPLAAHRLPDGSKVEGLARQADGRWRISATGEVFFERDEHVAVARFEATMARLRKQNVVALPLPPQPGPEAAFEAVESSGATQFQMSFAVGKPVQYAVLVGSEPYWAAVRQHLTDPRLVARMTGVEWVSRGADLPIPKPSPTLTELIDTYAAKPGVTREEIQRVKKFWGEFVTVVDGKTLREIDHDRVAAYEAWIADRDDLSPKSIKHRYSRIRTVVAYAMRRGKNPDDCRRALDVLQMLETPDGANPIDPKPIAKDDFWAIHSSAVEAGDDVFAALMLFALNAALYPSEVGSVKWSEIDIESGMYVSRRRKTGIVRVAGLWPETVTAMKALPQNGDYAFQTSRMHFTRFSVHRQWEIHRKTAKRETVTFDQIRDGAFTSACRVSLDQARVLAGHKFGGATDNYVARHPGFVRDAVNAIHADYFPPFTAKKARKMATRPARPEKRSSAGATAGNP